MPTRFFSKKKNKQTNSFCFMVITDLSEDNSFFFNAFLSLFITILIVVAVLNLISF